MWNLKQNKTKHKNELIDSENQMMIVRGGRRNVDEGGQKVKASSHKISCGDVQHDD